MTPGAYLEQLRSALDEYEVAEQEARRCLQERLRELLGLELVVPIEQPDAGTADAEGATGAGPLTGVPLPSPAIDSSPAGETARRRKGVRASMTPPAATHECDDCHRSFASASALGGHRKVHGAARRVVIDAPAPTRPASPPGRTASESATDSPGPGPGVQRPQQLRPPSVGISAPASRRVIEPNPRSAPPLELPQRAEAFAGE